MGMRLVSWLRGLLSLVKVGIVTAIVAAFLWAWYDRGAVQLLPFDGKEDAALSIRLGRALEDVAAGSTSAPPCR